MPRIVCRIVAARERLCRDGNMSDALALYNPADYDLSGATADELVKQLALVGKRRRRRRADDESSLESESDEDDDLEPPGPLDPEHCLVRH